MHQGLTFFTIKLIQFFQQIKDNQLLILIMAFTGTSLLALITWEVIAPHKVDILFPKEMVCILFYVNSVS